MLLKGRLAAQASRGREGEGREEKKKESSQTKTEGGKRKKNAAKEQPLQSLSNSRWEAGLVFQLSVSVPR